MPLSRMNDALKRSCFHMLEQHLPSRTKRLVFLASLTARLKGQDSFDNETLQKLNEVMSLSNSDSALKLPMQLSRAIWHGKTAYEIFDGRFNNDLMKTPEHVGEMVECIMSTMPAWLRYGNKLEICSDIEMLLKNQTPVV